MGVDGCGQFCKCFLILFSVFFTIVALAMVFLGLVLRFSPYTAQIFDVNLETQEFVIFVVVLIILGGLMLAVAILGFHGACNENKSSLGVFTVLVGIMAGVELGTGVLVLMKSREVSIRIGNWYASLYAQCINSRDPTFKATLALIHSLFNCCGIGGAIEIFVRDTCPPQGHFITAFFKTNSCVDVIPSIIEDNAGLVMGFFMVLTFILIFALVSSAILSKSIRNSLSVPSYVLLTEPSFSAPSTPFPNVVLTVTGAAAEEE